MKSDRRGFFTSIAFAVAACAIACPQVVVKAAASTYAWARSIVYEAFGAFAKDEPTLKPLDTRTPQKVLSMKATAFNTYRHRPTTTPGWRMCPST